MRTYQVYVQGRPTSVGLTPPPRPLWQGQPMLPEAGPFTGSTQVPMESLWLAEKEPDRARD